MPWSGQGGTSRRAGKDGDGSWGRVASAKPAAGLLVLGDNLEHPPTPGMKEGTRGTSWQHLQNLGMLCASALSWGKVLKTAFQSQRSPSLFVFSSPLLTVRVLLQLREVPRPAG